MSSLKRGKYAVHDLKHRFVWVPKYRRQVLQGEVVKGLKEVFKGITERYGPEIDTMEVMEDHVHLFVPSPPKYSLGHVVQVLKTVSAREVFRRHPQAKERLWGMEFWSDEYCVRSVGNEATAEVIRQYIKL